jgi:glycosyltransferase involved in cell wall biosynthesis
MALGLVPIVVDYGGPGEIVTDETGFRLKLASRDNLVSEAAGLLSDIADGRYDLTKMATSARDRVNKLYTWDEKARQLAKVYDWVCDDRLERPEFAFLDGRKPRRSNNDPSQSFGR